MQDFKNFGRIKSTFNGILAEGVVSKKPANSVLFKKYIKTIKENEILKTQFLVFNNIENKYETDETKATNYVKENINLFSKFKIDDIINANLKLAEPILSEQNCVRDTDKDKLHENITKLILTKRTPNNIDEIVEATNEVVSYIISNKPKTIVEAINLPNSIISTMMVDKYNEKYSTLDETEKRILKVLIDSTDEQKKEVYNSTLRECIDLINTILPDSDVNTKDKLLQVKDKLLNDKVDINEDFYKNISKLVELKNSLQNN